MVDREGNMTIYMYWWHSDHLNDVPTLSAHANVVGTSVQGASEAGPESRVREKREGLEGRVETEENASHEHGSLIKTPRHKEKKPSLRKNYVL
jgi:hypothetical protein